MGSTQWQKHWRTRRVPFAEECRRAGEAFLVDLKDPATAQRRVLDDVIALCADSLHWKERGHDVLTTAPDAFRDTLPVMRYDDFTEEIDREIRTKGGTLSCSPVLRWLKTSGTTGVPKRVPYTLHWLLKYRIPAMRAMWGVYLEHHPEILAHPYAALDTQTVYEDVDDFLAGVPYQAISNRHPKINARDWNPPWSAAPWFGTAAPSSHSGRMYHRIRHFLGEDLRFVSAINPSTLISLRDLIVEHGEDLVRDLAEGTLEGRPHTDPDPERARRFQAILDRGEFTLKDVWPSLNTYSSWLSSSAKLYLPRLEAVLPGVSAMPFMSCGTEGVTTIPVDDSLDSQPLAVGQAFFEFVPAETDLGALLDAGERVETLLFDEVEEGRDYHLIMTQANGLYRLWTGDVYHVDRFVDGTPWVHFVHRDGIFHSFTGEKITETQVTRAIERAMTAAGRSVGLYLCGPRWSEPPYYVMVGEISDPGEEQDRLLSEGVDRALQDINIEYASKRTSGRLAPLTFTTVPHGGIAAYVESRRQRGNTTQYKYKPFQQDTDFAADILGDTASTGAHR
ncbi:GH3 auxin-responsive promoter family protein [Nocardiopsis alba]|uniref:GH3 auxin-responsive promoter n=1 Tax=Nocardiopsis alba TaxID=53437 RepID=A0A7K2ITR7_9ACTN|nr:GH3 auxin-responsive promoter [Nocardiopsis alba]